MKQYIQDRFIVVGGLALVGIGFGITNGYPDESAFFPRMCLLCIGVLLILLGIESILTERRLAASGAASQTSLPVNYRRFIIVTGTLAAYGIGIPILGFYTASSLLLLVVGFLWKGVKKPVIFVFTLCFLIFLYICFTILFNVPLPAGLLK
jgi:hypothetical protein